MTPNYTALETRKEPIKEVQGRQKEGNKTQQKLRSPKQSKRLMKLKGSSLKITTSTNFCKMRGKSEEENGGKGGREES